MPDPFVTPWTVCSSPWEFLGKNTRLGCHFLLRGLFLTQEWNPHFLLCRQILYHWATYMCACVLSQSVMSDCETLDCSPPGSSVPGIFCARILKRVAMSFSRGSSQSKEWICVSCDSWTAGRFFTTEPQNKPTCTCMPVCMYVCETETAEIARYRTTRSLSSWNFLG